MRPTPAGDFDYDAQGAAYAQVRQPDPRIAQHVHAALGDARTVLNVGAGTGSYEPLDRHVVAVEPSAQMRSQRPRHLAPAIDAVAEHLPFDDGAFDASMAMITVHQWPDLERGLAEMRRVTLGPVAILTIDRHTIAEHWIAEYCPSLIATDQDRLPEVDRIAAALGGEVQVTVPSIPLDCTDGFIEAFYGRPERVLEPEVRAAQSGWGFVTDEEEQACVARLRADLESGAWDERHGALRTQPTYEGSLRLVVSRSSDG
jgi:hypothetical protein